MIDITTSTDVQTVFDTVKRYSRFSFDMIPVFDIVRLHCLSEKIVPRLYEGNEFFRIEYCGYWIVDFNHSNGFSPIEMFSRDLECNNFNYSIESLLKIQQFFDEFKYN